MVDPRCITNRMTQSRLTGGSEKILAANEKRRAAKDIDNGKNIASTTVPEMPLEEKPIQSETQAILAITDWTSAENMPDAPDVDAGTPPKKIKLLTSSSRGSTKISHVIIHFSSGLGADAAAWKKDAGKPERIVKIFQAANVSAHYLIDRAGNTYQLVPESRKAQHAAPYNSRSIGIEMIAFGTKVEMIGLHGKSAVGDEWYNRAVEEYGELRGFSETQYESLQKLIVRICKNNPNVKKDRSHIIGHSEVPGSKKPDPGSLFDWSMIGLT